MALTLHIGNKRYSSWSLRPWLLLKALDIPFTEQLHFLGGDFRQRAQASFSPTGTVPVLHTADGIIVTDSLAIVEFIAEDYPAVWPSDRVARAWARCAAAEMHSGFSAIRNQCSMNVALRFEPAEPNDALAANIARIDALWTEGLEKFGGPWLAGSSFTAVDAFFAPVVSRLQTYAITLSPNAEAYKERMLVHPAFVAWVEEGLKETERLEDHELEAYEGRTLAKDLCA
ncbi:glutathione S-transferase [Plectosphaerella plurivora]|uniref:Glutathione S-transferase n=1 Tax=Plectosphaerella plurivora TaxID=936078 RepID=A0A9P9AFP5_9PEZI|nr:glutathione S-transferase [Plectosphaerella plurivora]